MEWKDVQGKSTRVDENWKTEMGNAEFSGWQEI